MTPTLPNPLHDLHQKNGAEFQPYGDLEIVSTYGEGPAEYAALHKAAALIDEPQRGFLKLQGKDRLSFLNNLLTNETWSKTTKSGLAAGQGVYAFFLSNKGRIITDLNVIERGDYTLLEMDARLVDTVRVALEKYLFAEQVTFTNMVGSLHQVSLYGPGSAALLNASLASQALPSLGSTAAAVHFIDLLVWRDDIGTVPGFHLVVGTELAELLWTSLLSQASSAVQPGKRALRPAGWVTYNAVRIEAGRPIFHIDFDETVLPAETGQLSRAVSFTKGCYVGQEVVARMHARGQLAKKLAGLRLDDDSLPIAGAPVYDDASNQIGGITSSTVSPRLSNAAICLAYLKRPFFEIGKVVNVPAEGKVRQARVVEMPFV